MRVLAEVERARLRPSHSFWSPIGTPTTLALSICLQERTRAPVRAVDPNWCRGTVPLGDREEIEVGGLQLTVIATPGHTDDSVSFFCLETGRCVTGDTILGEGSSLIAWPDGQLGAYLDSLKRLRDIAAAGLSLTLLPGARAGGPLGSQCNRHAHRTPEPTVGAGRSGARPGCDVDDRDRGGGLRPAWSGPARRRRGAGSRRSWSTWRPPEMRVRLTPYVAALSASRLVERLVRRRAACTERASSRIHPREAKSASDLFTVSRDAPTSWASSS